MSPGRDPDEDLVRRAGRGDPAAVQALVARKLPRVLNLAGRMLGDPAEAEDVAQEALLRAWKQAPGWKSGKARFDTWLHRVTLNLCYDRLRRREITGVQLPDRADPAPGAHEEMQARQLGVRVQAALAALPERQRSALALCHFQEIGAMEAADIMGVSIEALESLLARGRRRLRELLLETAREEGLA
ncbi:RNA polymerase sigma factor [Brevundimonas sp. 2R-24]|uniref:RNA polymerase sigma factor n=1 Tax=Peiella sedimenti TaxID=3061083 RepID=A0ABT8SJA7_9CAUL|nr:RNA polymerase sigma factor [Caulobacteraceae bacterium XZ-24]